MEKNKVNVHAVNVHLHLIATLLLLGVVVVLGLKYLHLKMSVSRYTSSTMWINSQNRPTGLVSDYAVIIGSAVQSLDPKLVQSYITDVSSKLKRDIVVLDRAKKIMADSINQNKGKVYSYDRNSEIKMTITDGNSRIFEEKSPDFPNGIVETVVAMKNSKGEIIGAVLISNSQI